MNTKKIKLNILGLLLLLIPVPIFASNITIYSNHKSISVGDIIVLKVILNTKNLNINVVEGEIDFLSNSNLFSLRELSISNSSFSLWPRNPSYEIGSNRIVYTGGVVGGVKGDNIALFNIVIEAKKEGRMVISPSNTTMYVNDGKGTRLEAQFEPTYIDISEKATNSSQINEWNNLISLDNEPPEAFTIDLGMDTSIFDGKRFISWSTTDNSSGIDYYTVTEDDLPPVLSSSPYVLQKQDNAKNIFVTAYDKAGNSRVVSYEPKNSILSIIVILLLIIVLFVYIKFKKRNEVI